MRSDECKKEIIKIIRSMSGRHSVYDVFNDWVTCFAISISNSTDLIHNELWHAREQQYLDIVKKYEKDQQLKFAELSAYLVEALTSKIDDALGDIYMRLDVSNKNAGQFFTPYSISRLAAKLAIDEKKLDEGFLMNEPSVGAGGMVIAAVDIILNDYNKNPQMLMRVACNDLDWRCVYMTYVQLSLLGIKAVVYQGDTLKEPYPTSEANVFRTPTEKGLLLV